MKPYIKLVLILSTLYICVIGDEDSGIPPEVKFELHEEEYEDAMTLDCKAYGYPQSVTINREQNEGFLSKWEGAETIDSKTLLHDFVDGGCDLMASYKCSAMYSDGNVISKVLDYKRSNCPPKFCPKTNLSQRIELNVESKASFNICVIAYPNITVCEYRPSNSKMCSQDNHIKITTDNDESVIYFNIRFEINKVDHADFGKYSLEIETAPTLKLMHSFRIDQPMKNKKSFCNREHSSKKAIARVGEMAVLTICVHDDSKDFCTVEINDKRFIPNEYSHGRKINVFKDNLNTKNLTFIDIIIAQVRQKDFKVYNISIRFNQGEELILDYCLEENRGLPQNEECSNPFACYIFIAIAVRNIFLMCYILHQERKSQRLKINKIL